MVEQAERIPQPSPGAGDYLELAMAWSNEVRSRSRLALDVPYGEDDRQKLDIYMPDEWPPRPAPVLLFMAWWLLGNRT